MCPRYGLISKRQQNYKAHISRDFMTPAKFAEHKFTPHVYLNLWRNTPAKFHSNPCKDVEEVEKTN